MARTRAFIPELPAQPPAGGPSAGLLPGAARGQMGRGVYESIRTAIGERARQLAESKRGAEQVAAE